MVCRYRLPSEHQPWIHGIHIGEVVEPGDDPATWNGHNSEREYCELARVVPVRYCRRFSCSGCRARHPEGFLQHDGADALTRITEEEAGLSLPAQVLRFIGLEALRNLARAHYPGASDLLAEQDKEVSA